MSSPYIDREQTEVKHKILERYLEAFVPIVGNWAHDVTYIDCLAGPWESADPNLQDTSFGHAIDVLRKAKETLAHRGKKPTMRCLLIEKNPKAFERLKAYGQGVTDIEVTTKNWDFTHHIPEIVQYAKSSAKSFPFVFIDPTGWEPLEISVITPLLRLVPGEVLINLMTSWIRRFLSVESKQFERLLGENLEKLRELKGEEQEDELVRSYASSVKRAGMYEYVCTLPVMKADQDAFHYHLIYGTRHTRGVEVFKEMEKAVIPFMHEVRAEAQERKRYEQTGQLSMLAAGAHYRERKFSQFRVRNLLLAKNEVRFMLEKKARVPYDDVWATAMAFPTVIEPDLREWLAEWQSAKLISFTNLGSRQKSPSKGKKHSITWIGAPAE